MRQRHKVKYRALPGDAPAGVGEAAGSSDSDPDEDSWHSANANEPGKEDANPLHAIRDGSEEEKEMKVRERI